MQGALFQQPCYGNTAGYFGGQSAGFGAAPATGYFGGQTAGFGGFQGGSYFGGQAGGFGGAQGGSYFGGQSGGFGGAQNFSFGAAAPVASQSFGQNVISSQQTEFSTGDFNLKHSGSSTSSGSLNADNQANAGHLEASTGSVGSAPTVQRRAGRHQKQVIRLPEPPQGPPRQVRHRLPTPEPDVIERVLIQRAAPEIIEEITEVPSTPPPRIQERHVVEPAGPPKVIKRTVRVAPRSAGTFSAGAQSFGGAQTSSSFQQIGASTGFGSFGGGFQQANAGFGGFQQQAAPAVQPSMAQAKCFYI